MIRAETVVRGIGQLATLAGPPGPRRGAAARDLGIVEEAALAVDAGRVVWTGPDRLLDRFVRRRPGGRWFDAAGSVVVPGFVDAHTHAVFFGDRSDEVERKLSGASYGEIARSGGGLYATVRATRHASDAELERAAAARLGRMARHGTTAVEVKSGYALSHAGELRLLRVIGRLGRRRRGPRVVATYLGAHAVPDERRSDRRRYVDEIVRRTVPAVARERLARFVDVFCEPGFFSPRESRAILTAARQSGLDGKIHADEFVRSGGAPLAARLRLRSADHLLAATARDREQLARAGVTAVILPVTPFASLASRRSPGRELVDAGVAVALGTDCSPNSYVESMPIALNHAVYSAHLTPAEALTAATVNAAWAVGLEGVAGRLTPGRPADFALFPVRRVREIPYRIGVEPAAVFREGKPLFSGAVRPYF